MAVNLYRDDKGEYGLQTDAPDERTFRQECVTALTALVEAQTYKGEWQLALHRWLGQMCDICHAYQGHTPPTVDIRMLYSTGNLRVQEPVPDDTGEVVVPVVRPSLVDVVPPSPGGGRP